MTRHSKNNTAGAYFTSAEREKLKYGTSIERLGKDSLRLPTSCCLCIQRAIHPVVCDKGHLFCKECILTFILKQKIAIKEGNKSLAEEEGRLQVEKVEVEEDRLRRKIEDFERLNGPKRIKTVEQGKTVESKAEDTSAVQRTHKAPTTPMCPISDHPVGNVKKLIKLEWTFDNETCICGICRKDMNLSNSITVLATCGHLFCAKCLESSNKGAGSGTAAKDCFNCGRSSDKLISLATEGSGYSSSGSNIELKSYKPSLI